VIQGSRSVEHCEGIPASRHHLIMAPRSRRTRLFRGPWGGITGPELEKTKKRSAINAWRDQTIK
jgi:hypothetical protein